MYTTRVYYLALIIKSKVRFFFIYRATGKYLSTVSVEFRHFFVGGIYVALEMGGLEELKNPRGVIELF